MDLRSRIESLGLRGGFLAAGLVLFFLPWVELGGAGYSGFTFRDFAAAVAAGGGAPRAAPITWDLVLLQPAAALGALILRWRGQGAKAGDFLAGFAAFVGPIALAMVAYEAPQARLQPAAYAVFALALAVLLLDFRLGRPGRREPPAG